MQAINDAEIEAAGAWRDFALIPHGLLYRVVPRYENMIAVEREWSASYTHHLDVLKKFPNPLTLVRPGTWEFAAISIYYDSQYQFALTLLTFALEIQPSVDKIEVMSHYLQKLGLSSKLLLRCVLACEELAGTPLSYPKEDLYKNTALSHMRFLAAFEVVRKESINTQLDKIGQPEGLPAVRIISEEFQQVSLPLQSWYYSYNTHTRAHTLSL